MDQYKTISKSSSSEFHDRGSKFLGYAFPLPNVEEFRQRLATLKKQHPRAVHYCFAYRLGTEGLLYRSSDDGEPPGSAGKPILGQIDSKGLTQVLVIVVRYFGGTLLGVPGLIHAYKTATSLVLDSAGMVDRQVMVHYEVLFDYTRVNEVMRLTRQFGCEIISQDLQLFCKMKIAVPKKNEMSFLAKSSELHGISFSHQP